MLAGKTFPQNVRTLCMVVEELLREILSCSETIACYTNLMEILDDRVTVVHRDSGLII